MPQDRTVQISSEICQSNITWTNITTSEREAKKFYETFLNQTLIAYKDSDNFDQDLYDDAKKTFEGCVYISGPTESYRYEFQLIRTRIRYFEIIPQWELARISDDMVDSWQHIVELRSNLTEWERTEGDVDLFTDETFEAHKKNYSDCLHFIRKWSQGKDFNETEDGEEKLPLTDGHKHRNYVKKNSEICTEAAKLTENWALEMAFNQWRWKANRTHDFNSSNYLYVNYTEFPKSDEEGRAEEKMKNVAIREFVMSDLRENWRMKVWREFHKLAFHQIRRI